MNSKTTDPLVVSCPCCHATLTVEASSGTVLRHQTPTEPRAGGHDLDDLFAEAEQRKKTAEAVLAREQHAHDNRDELLEARFQDALDRVEAADDGKPARSPFDLD